ncbi:MAG: nucleoid-associated protein YbaB/EbfC family [Bacillales bacterium]|jgi:DNA-binding YbaB/EbfC family protein|nr:nucleoid-associated protein YbaB/EbfC family [Bacillales bacterium]
MMRGGNMNNMLKQAQKMQKKMMEAQEEVGKTEVEGTAGGGMVTVRINGKKEIIKVNIKPEVVDPEDIEMLEDLILTATNDAIKQIDEISDKKMGPLTKGLNMPGLF